MRQEHAISILQVIVVTRNISASNFEGGTNIFRGSSVCIFLFCCYHFFLVLEIPYLGRVFPASNIQFN
jgi:hypothetical protein